MSKKISTTVSDEYHAELTAYCHALGDMPLSAFARYAMQQYMNRHPKKTNKSEKAAHRPPAWKNVKL